MFVEQDHLQEFVASEAEQGELDSSGEFTLSRNHALRKLSESHLEQPADWVLEMVPPHPRMQMWLICLRVLV